LHLPFPSVPPLGAVDGVEADSLSVLLVQDLDGVAVEDGNNRTGDV
jgi:hypothetical protein